MCVASDLASPPLTRLRQTLEKIHEKQVDKQHIFVDYKAAFESPLRDRVYAAMSELDLPTKLMRLCRMTFSNFCCSVKVGIDLSESSDSA